MQKKGIISILVRLWFVTIVCWCMSSCSMVWSDEEDMMTQCPKGVRQTVTLNLTITHPDAGINTRAESDYELSFTKDEAAVKKLTVFIVDLNSDGSENYDKVEHYSTELDPIDFYNGIYVFQHTLEVETGSKHLYIGANLRQEHIDAFLNNKPIALDGEGPAVNMVMTPDPTHSGKGTDIAMFGQIKMRNGSSDIVISQGMTDYYLSGDLERLTAKVLLTCDEGEPGLVRTGGKGWVETDKIRYTLNATNKYSFIKRVKDVAYDVNIDPNWALSPWIVQENGIYIPSQTHSQQFEYWDGEDIMTRIFDDRYSTTPLKFDEKRVGVGNSLSENHYVEGLYCLENTAYNDMGLSGDALDNAARVATTHMIIVVRFIPRVFVGGWNDNTESGTLERALTELFIPNSGSTINGSGTHSTGTYWTRTVNGQTIYYAWTGVQRKIKEEGLKESDFTCYEGGYSYFSTFIDGTTDGLKLTYNGHDSWGVQRDHYYILTVDQISRPGSPIPDWDDYIRINSQTVDWVYRGSQDVIIRPTGN